MFSVVTTDSGNYHLDKLSNRSFASQTGPGPRFLRAIACLCFLRGPDGRWWRGLRPHFSTLKILHIMFPNRRLPSIYSIMLAADIMADSPLPHVPAERRAAPKTPLTPKQKRARVRSKLARKSRKINYARCK